MRDLRFRAWDKEFGEMLQVGQITFAPNCDRFEQAYLMDEHNDIHYLDDVEIMQYTGLEDKHGTPIYEGDIVNHPDLGKKEVEFVGGAFVLKGDGINFTGKLLFSECEIIGNKWEGCKCETTQD